MAVALGVGTNTAILSVVDATRLRPLPFDDASALVSVWLEGTQEADGERIRLTAADLADFRAEPGLFGALAGWRPVTPTYGGVAAPEVVDAAEVTAGMFSGVLRVRPILGRTFLPEEDRPGAGPTVLLSHGFWSEHFGSDPEVIGRSVSLDDVPHVVVGVMPPGFVPPFHPSADLWTPARLDAARCRRGCPTVAALGRLATGTSLAVSRDRASMLALRLEESYPETNAGLKPSVASLTEELRRLSADSARRLFVGGGLVLLIACANVALLLLARGLDRARELRVRRALGATGGRLVRQLLTESVTLAAIGGVLGLGVAVWGVEALTRTAPAGLFEGARPTVDTGILLAVVLLTLVTGAVFGSAPALAAALGRATLPGAPPHMPRGTGSRRGRAVADALRGGAVALQVGLATAMAIGAGGLIQGLHSATTDGLGFDPEGVLAVRVQASPDRIEDPATAAELVRRLEDGLAALPGAFSVGASGSLPLDDAVGEVALTLEDDDPTSSEPSQTLRVRRVSSGYFYTVGQRLSEGRWFRPQDDAEREPVVILNATAARRFFRDPPRSPVGSRVALGDGRPIWRTVVGVVRDERRTGGDRPPEPVAYLPIAQAPPEALALVVRIDGEPTELIEEARAALADVDPTLYAGVVEPMTARVDEAYAAERFASVLATVFASIALILAVVGLYGVLAHGVASRLRELGLRRAVGATDDDLRRRVLVRAAGVVCVGVVLGWVGAVLFVEGLDTAVAGAGLRTPVVYAMTLTVLAVGGVAASAWPIRRSISMDPAAALRPD